MIKQQRESLSWHLTFIEIRVWTVRNWILPDRAVNKDPTVISDCSHHRWWACDPWGNSGRKKYLVSSSHQPVATPHSEPWGNSGCENSGYWPKIAGGADQRNDFSEPRLLHLPMHRNVLNFLKWDVWFSLIYCYLSVFPTTSSLFQNSCISWLLPYLFEVVPQSDLRGCAPELCPQFCPPNKTFWF